MRLFRNARSVLVLLLTLMIALALVGCFGGDENSGASTAESDNSGAISEAVSEVGGESEIESLPEQTSSEEESSEPEPQDTVISFLGCPDNIIHPSVFYDAIERAAAANGTAPKYTDLHNQEYDFAPIYEFVAEQIKNADISYINQETLPGGTSRPIIGYPCFNSPEAIAYTDIDLGFDVINLAHNHMLDSGNTTYLENAYRIFREAGLTVIGYYENDAAVDNIPIIEYEGVKIAFLAYTYGTNGINLPKNSAAVIPYFSRELLQRQIPAARELADVVIVSAHWGDEDYFQVNNYQKQYAQLMCDLGVDIVLGMHPHVIQPIEWMTNESGHKTLVVYSLGNYVSGMVAGKNMLAGMLSCDIVKSVETGDVSIENVVFIPTVTHYVKKNSVAGNDTGYREFKIYYLSDYNEEIAAEHGVNVYERGHAPTLVGGKFSYANLVNTLTKYISSEFLPEEFQLLPDDMSVVY